MNNMIWWQGVVEDRYDPLKLGRCRVRVLGLHTNNKEDGVGIPTEHLPWATPSQPITSAGINGIGTTPMGPVEGTWVFGFFRDGEEAQQPVMMGTFGGISQEVPVPSKGFNDPYGVYPLSTHIGEKDDSTGKYSGESDTNRLARGGGDLPVPEPASADQPKNSENSPSLNWKRKTRDRGVPTGVAGDISDAIQNTDNSSLYGFSPWNEPNPRYGGTTDSHTEYLSTVGLSSTYPFNHVRMSESGHVEEWDDTPSAERMHRFHKSGTFEEIQPDGTRVVKVRGSDYEIVLKDKDVYIQGSCNVTINGDCRMLTQGDLVQEVYGDYHLNVHGERRTKIAGNDSTEVLSDRKTIVNGFDDLVVGDDAILNVAGQQNISISGLRTDTVTGSVTNLYFDSCTELTGIGGHQLFSAGSIGISALINLGLSSVLNYSRTTFGTSMETTTLLHTETCLGGRVEVTTGLSHVSAGTWTNLSGIITLN